MRVSIVSSALVAVLVGFGGSVAIVLAGADAVGASAAEKASWVAALCLSMAATSAGMSFYFKVPMVTAWSTPGAALIGATAINGVPTLAIEQAVAAFIIAACLMILSSAVKPLADAIAKIPMAIASAMLAGVLIGFSIAVFDAAQSKPLLVLPLIALFILIRLFSATWAVLCVLAAAGLWSFMLGEIDTSTGIPYYLSFEIIRPEFDVTTLVGLGLPLFLVSMASQNLPGFAVLKASGYEPPARPALAITGLASLLTAPFGAHTTTMAAITAALCTGPDTHPDRAQRWKAGIFYGLFYLILSAVAVTLVACFAALPGEVIVTVAGLALLGPFLNSLSSAFEEQNFRFEAALTLCATASGLALFGIGSAFWGLVFGLFAYGARRLVERKQA